MFRKLVPAALIALPLAACAATPGILSPGEPAHISKVQVSLAPNVSAPGFAESVQAKTLQYAARFQRAGAPKELRIVVERHTYKNPALALLVGDANHVGGRVAVIDVASGRVQDEVEAAWSDNHSGGVVGLIVSAAQEKQRVDDRLADGLAKIALRLALGSAIVDPVLFRDDPIIYMPPVKRVPQRPAEESISAAKQAPARVAANR
ncbi:hypothetical protein [Hansschlegelia sp. KR7-227]|uniref:hypothetical protein n=1 Tax=Hansschlegelia sp. KR7-227 TaxID=3400914 RepID=UPI003C05BE42